MTTINLPEKHPRKNESSGDNLVSKYFHGRDEAIAYLSAAGNGATLRGTTLEDVFVECAGRKLQ